MSAETSVVRVGLIGVGKMGLHHLKAMAATPLARIVGVADPAASEDDLRPLLPAGAVVVKSAAELYAQAKPDVVHIVTPPHTHEALALEAIAAGCHVYIEKPFTPTAAAAARVLDAARARGLKVCAGHQVLFEAPASKSPSSTALKTRSWRSRNSRLARSLAWMPAATSSACDR